MKKLSLIISLLIAFILVSACATAPTTAAPTALPEIIPTSTPTSIPPTSTIQPSPTVDPNMPEGATGKDTNGNYTKTENGLTVTWNKDLNTWERHVMVNDVGVPLLPEDANGHPALLLLYVNISDQMPGFDKVGSLSFIDPGNTHPEFLAQISADFTKVLAERTSNDWGQLYGNGLNLSFTTKERTTPWVWNLGPGHSIYVDILAAPVGPGFQTWTNVQKNTYQSRLFTDEQGNLHVWIVPELKPGTSIDQYSPQDLMKIYLFGFVSILNSSDQTTQGYSAALSVYAAEAVTPGRTIFSFGPPQ